MKSLALLTLLLSLNPDSNSDLEYWRCIEQHPCKHDGEDLKKLSKKEYMETMSCRIERHLACIKTETQK